MLDLAGWLYDVDVDRSFSRSDIVGPGNSAISSRTRDVVGVGIGDLNVTFLTPVTPSSSVPENLIPLIVWSPVCGSSCEATDDEDADERRSPCSPGSRYPSCIECGRVELEDEEDDRE